MPIKDVTIDKNDIKTGYICDIKSLNLVFNDKIENIVLKIENDENDLSNVAKKLNLYNNELDFYSKISSTINLNVPNFYGSLIIENKKSIIMENLNVYNGDFNINLNKNIDLLLLVVKNISDMHNNFYFKNQEEVISTMKDVVKINEITYYKELINIRFNKFLKINNVLLTDSEIKVLNNIHNNYSKLIDKSGTFPLNFCHGDLKSPNIFYKENSNKTITPIFLDWQYIHLNKGISDIVFLLVESTNF